MMMMVMMMMKMKMVMKMIRTTTTMMMIILAIGMLDLLCEIVNKLPTEQLTKYVDASGDDDDGDDFGCDGDDDVLDVSV